MRIAALCSVASDIGHKKHAHVCNVWRLSGPLADPASFDCLTPHDSVDRSSASTSWYTKWAAEMIGINIQIYGRAKCATSKILMKGCEKDSRLELSPSTFLAENWIILARRHLWKWKRLPVALSSHSRPAQRWLFDWSFRTGKPSLLYLVQSSSVAQGESCAWLCQARGTSWYRWRDSFVFTLW